ncbi:hypothetical protein BBJ28_00022241 [Nothophytophthora sp. Chile5]|nr:hypothetical protein BBJ28_00022241 [Nothophytophthora sp. Chile5]
MTTFNKVVAFLLLGLVRSAATLPSSTVTFYDNTWHDDSGGSQEYTVIKTQMCIDLCGFSDRAKWADVAETGEIDGKTRIAFYTDAACKGTVRDWAVDAPDGFPGNFFLDGIDNQISSFMIWKVDKFARSYQRLCNK